MKEYALYRGDTFVDIGTARELAEKHNTTMKVIHWLAHSNKAKEKREKCKKGMIVIPLDFEEEV